MNAIQSFPLFKSSSLEFLLVIRCVMLELSPRVKDIKRFPAGKHHSNGFRGVYRL